MIAPVNGLNGQRWHERLITGQALATILIALVGQAAFSIIYQVKDNEQQAAAIKANDVRIISTEAEVTRLAGTITHADAALGGRIEAIDRGGTRALESVTANQQRVLQSIERISERLGQLDGRLNMVENKGLLTLQAQVDQVNIQIKRIDEQQVRIIQALDNTYNTLTDFMREFTVRVPPPKAPGIQQEPSVTVPLPRPKRNNQ